VFGGKGGMNWDPVHLTPGDYTYTVFMHEFGHSLGLKHSFESGGVGGAVPHAFDSLEYTLMSYDAYQMNPYSSTVDQRNWWADDGNNPTTFMMLDIAALQQIYGADYTTNAGNTVYDVHDPSVMARTSAGKLFMTLWDGGGIDTYDLSGYSVGVSIDLQPGHLGGHRYSNSDE
jgi:serralysin